LSTPEPDQGFAEFFRTCLPVLTRTLTALTGDTRVVEDVAQDALVIARHRWHDIHAYDKQADAAVAAAATARDSVARRGGRRGAGP
jgi:DNA-directed RNA polymerase specialized sigma24 family protein